MSKRNYAAAKNIARYGDFGKAGGSADAELLPSLTELRNRCRNLARNSGTMKRYLQLLRDNVMGENGLRVQSDPRVEEAWLRWCKSPTVDGVMHLIDFQHQAVQSWGRDGEYFVEFVYSSRFPDGVALNPLESDMCDHTLNDVAKGSGNRIRMGVEIDAFNRPVAYHFLTEHPGDISWWSPKTQRRYRRVPAEKVLHIYKRLRPGQTRGEPPAASIVNDIKMLDGYREAEVMNRRIASATMGFFSRELPKADGITALADRTEKDEDGEDEFIMDLEPGTMKQLPDGMRFDKFDPGGSQTDYAQFESQVKKNISLGLGISTMSLGMETAGISYSNGRTIVQEDRDFYKAEQGFWGRMLMARVFAVWATMHTLSRGSTIAPTKLQRIIDEVKVRGRGWTWVDPLKEVKANAEALMSNQTSLTQIAADQGMDVEDLLAEIERDNALLEQYGLTMPVVSGNVASATEEDGNDG